MKIARRKRSRIPLFVALAIIIAISIAGVMFYLDRPAATPTPQPTAQKTVQTEPAKKELLLPEATTAIPLPLDKTLLTSPGGRLALVNKQKPVDLDYAPTDLVIPDVTHRTDKPAEEIMVRNVVAKPLADMFMAAKVEKLDLLLGSAYRSSKLQEMYFNSYAAASGLEEAEKYSAHPGTSEHQLGLAVDISTTDRVCYLEKCFETSAAGKWLAANAHRYGFILRYPDGKAETTGYNYEPWHFRYLGVNIATAIFESGLTYEEAFPYLTGEKKP